MAVKKTPETGKEEVNIDSVEPQGTYAIRIVFDDGHDTGIYSWESLYELGIHQEEYWQQYLDRLAAAGYTRKGDRLDAAADEKLTLRLMYFSYLANKLGKESEEITAPDSVNDVQSLLAWLSRIKGDRGYLLAEANVPYDDLYEMDAINDDFQNTDVALVVGANDVINPAARHKKESVLYGMPILNVDHATTVMIIKRSLSPGFAGEDNELFYEDGTMMVFGDAKKMLTDITNLLKTA